MGCKQVMPKKAGKNLNGGHRLRQAEMNLVCAQRHGSGVADGDGRRVDSFPEMAAGLAAAFSAAASK